MFKFGKKRVLALATVAALAVAGIAYAYWTTSGSGSGTAPVGDVNGITVNQTSTISDLYPGRPAQSLSGDFTNTNASKVYVHTVTASLASVDHGYSDTSKPPCTIADFKLPTDTATVDAEVASGTSVGTWSGPTVELTDTGLNQDNCKLATLHISYSSN
jgi:hypothetical protein